MTEPHIAPRMNRQPERGVVSILFALLLPLLLGFGAFAIDYPNLLSVRTQMQTAADAAALAGARYLGEGGIPNWTAPMAQVQSVLGSNPIAGQSLTQVTIQVGYWDTNNGHAGLQWLPMNPTPTDIPAIQVSIAQATGQNNGEVKMMGQYAKGACCNEPGTLMSSMSWLMMPNPPCPVP